MWGSCRSNLYVYINNSGDKDRAGRFNRHVDCYYLRLVTFYNYNGSLLKHKSNIIRNLRTAFAELAITSVTQFSLKFFQI